MKKYVVEIKEYGQTSAACLQYVKKQYQKVMTGAEIEAAVNSGLEIKIISELEV